MSIRKRKKPDLVLPLSSMGDIAFLLIIFFMLASNFMKSANVELDKAVSPSIEQQDAAKCSVMIDKDRLIWFEGAQSTTGDVKTELQARAERDHDFIVHVTIHKTLETKDFMPLLNAISESGAKVILTGDPEE